MDEIVSLMNERNLDVNEKSVNEWINIDSLPLSNEYITVQQELYEIHIEREKEENDKIVSNLGNKNMSQISMYLDKLLNVMEGRDPKGELISEVSMRLKKTKHVIKLFIKKRTKDDIQLIFDKCIKKAPESA